MYRISKPFRRCCAAVCAFRVPNPALPRVICKLACLANLETLMAAATYAAPCRSPNNQKSKPSQKKSQTFEGLESCPFANFECRQCSVVRQLVTSSQAPISNSELYTKVHPLAPSCFQYALPSINVPSMSFDSIQRGPHPINTSFH